MRLIRRIVSVVFLLGIWTSVTGCNTVEGAGKDIEEGGEAIQRAAD